MELQNDKHASSTWCGSIRANRYHHTKEKSYWEKYNEHFRNKIDLQLPLAQTKYAENIYWVYGLIAKSEEQSVRVQKQLGELKIGTRPFFWCMHEQPVFNNLGFFNSNKFPVAEKLARNGFYIPSGLGITITQIDEVAENLIKIIANG